MTRRDDRREAIECQLLRGPATVRQLARALRRRPLFVYDDLTKMVDARAVVIEWVPRPGSPDGAVLAAYRLPTLAETTARDAGKAAAEQRLREALRARAEQVVPDTTTTPGGIQ